MYCGRDILGSPLNTVDYIVAWKVSSDRQTIALPIKTHSVTLEVHGSLYLIGLKRHSITLNVYTDRGIAGSLKRHRSN